MISRNDVLGIPCFPPPLSILVIYLSGQRIPPSLSLGLGLDNSLVTILLGHVVHGNTSDLCDSDQSEEEVDSSKAIIVSVIHSATYAPLRRRVSEIREKAYSMFLGVMTKHHRVQMRPVHISEKFCAKDSFSAGRARSEMPARTRAHCSTL